MIYIGSDHGGFAAKEKLKEFLTSVKLEFVDVGPEKLDPEDDYPIYALKVAESVSATDDPEKPWASRPKGILICRSAAGVVIAANKVIGIRAIAAFDETQAKHSREHNDANVLGLSADFLDQEKVNGIIQVWLATEFSKEERHKRRIDRISTYEAENWGGGCGGMCGGGGGGCCGGGGCGH